MSWLTYVEVFFAVSLGWLIGTALDSGEFKVSLMPLLSHGVALFCHWAFYGRKHG